MVKRLSDRTLDLLKTLSATPGPVGRENLVQDIIKEELGKYCSPISRDKIGNLIATMDGEGKHYVIVAHADEVGFLVSSIDERGFIRAKWNTQGYMPDLRLLPGQWVLVMTDRGFIPGCFAVKTGHIAGVEGKSRIPTYDEIFLDIGLSSREEVEEQGINIGDPIIYAAPVEKVGHNVVRKSMDDRIGLVVMIELAERLSKIPADKRPKVTFVSTVMEELGAKGAAAIAKDLNIDGVIAIDIGLADDHPGTNGEAGVGLGLGPVIVIKDDAMHYSHELVRFILDTAEREKIPVQRAVYHHYLTDGVQFAMQGQKVAVTAIPCRYSHSSFETINLKDVEMTIQLLEKVLLT
ncbi:MAG: M20/M25/M40 family metallo-hydrolase [Candidatus Thorarchaeota archaeon]|nr:MAG: M20/M25/M40 family metallo-hydrolase [Candidatus Thorarchaeota archaeon]